MLCSLEGLCPKCKHIQYKTIRDIIKNYKIEEKKEDDPEIEEAKQEKVKETPLEHAK